MSKIKLGDQVRDKVTGFAGVAVARTQWLHGCDRIAIQPPVDKDGNLPDNASFDIMSVELVKAEKPVKTSKTGGPQRESFLNRR